MLDGYIKLYRKTIENPIVWKDSEYLAVWIYLLLNATHRQCDKIFNGQKIVLIPGQLITSRQAISLYTKVNDSKVERILKTFKIEQQIEQQTCTKNRLISILRWEEYQKSEQQIEQQVNNNRTTSEQRLNTNKNERMKECKNVRKTYMSVIEKFNLICVDLPKVKNLSDKRKLLIESSGKILREITFEEVFKKVNDSDFLSGRVKDWKATFDWILNKANLIKIIEGNYDNKNEKSGTFDISAYEKMALRGPKFRKKDTDD